MLCKAVRRPYRSAAVSTHPRDSNIDYVSQAAALDSRVNKAN